MVQIVKKTTIDLKDDRLHKFNANIYEIRLAQYIYVYNKKTKKSEYICPINWKFTSDNGYIIINPFELRNRLGRQTISTSKKYSQLPTLFKKFIRDTIYAIKRYNKIRSTVPSFLVFRLEHLKKMYDIPDIGITVKYLSPADPTYNVVLVKDL